MQHRDRNAAQVIGPRLRTHFTRVIDLPLVSASLSTSPPTKPARSSFANWWFTTLPVIVRYFSHTTRWSKTSRRRRLLRTFFALMIFIQLEAFEACSTGDELVRELGLVVGVIVSTALLVDFLMSVLSVVWWAGRWRISVGGQKNRDLL